MSDDKLNPPLAGGLSVGTLSQAKRHKREFDAVLTLEDPSVRPNRRLRFTQRPCPDHLVLRFEDADSETFGYATATEDQVAAALAFGRKHVNNSLLVHCFHGVGRSAACALAILADRAGPGREADVVSRFFADRPQSTPNLVAVGYADKLLERNGALTAALANHEATDPVYAARRKSRWKLATDHPELFSRRQTLPE